MVSRLSAAFQHGSGTSRLTLRDRARRVVAHLLLQRPTGPSPRRRLAAAERRALRMRTSYTSRCARPPADSRVSHLGNVSPHIYVFASQVDKVKKAQPDFALLILEPPQQKLELSETNKCTPGQG